MEQFRREWPWMLGTILIPLALAAAAAFGLR
jgi:hypothetical protein